MLARNASQTLAGGTSYFKMSPRPLGGSGVNSKSISCNEVAPVRAARMLSFRCQGAGDERDGKEGGGGGAVETPIPATRKMRHQQPRRASSPSLLVPKIIRRAQKSIISRLVPPGGDQRRAPFFGASV